MKKHVKTSIDNRYTVIDSETGEILDEQIIKHTYLAGSKEQFYIGYVKLLSVFQDISGPAIKVYAYLLERYNAGIMIGINKALKNEIKKRINASGDSTVNNALTELVKIGLLYKQKDVYGAYFINPRYAFKGSTSDRDKLLKTVIELHCPNC